MPDDLKELLDGLNFDEPDTNTNLVLLSDSELLDGFANIAAQLKQRKEVLRPSTVEGRELHSKRSAYLVVLRQRNLR